MGDKTPARRFEDLIAWRKARELTRTVYRMTSLGSFSKDFALRDQARRAAVSIMSNLAEGFERTTRSEFHQFLNIAKSSCAELRSQLYVALDANHVKPTEFDEVLLQAEEVARIIGGLRAAVERQRNRAKNDRKGNPDGA
jgi:four helix bundle protein